MISRLIEKTDDMKGLTQLLLFLMVPLWGWAQQLEVGTSIGTTTYMGDLNQPPTLSFIGFRFAASAQARYQATPKIAYRANFMRGTIAGDDQNFENRRNWTPNLKFTAPITEFTGMIEFHPFNRSNLFFYDIDGKRLSLQEAKASRKVFDSEGTPLVYQDGYFVTYEGNGSKLVYDQFGNLTIFNKGGILMNRRFKPLFSPYLFTGIGAVITNPKVQGFPTEGDEQQESNYSKAHVTIPFGVGMRFQFHPSWAINAEGGIRAPFTDYLDGVSESRNPDHGDWYMHIGIGVTYTLGNKKPPVVDALDQDDDGIADDYDRCPNIPGTINLFGCPDKDNDGVADSEDLCPELSGIAAFGGCPDTDGDKVSDDQDLCPTIPGKAINKGCPLVGKKELEALEVATQTLQFQEDKVSLKESDHYALQQIANILHNYPNYKLQIEGHAFSMANENINQVVSENKALACKQYIVSQGIDAARIHLTGFGSSKPLTKAEKRKGRKDNNRVEFRLMLEVN